MIISYSKERYSERRVGRYAAHLGARGTGRILADSDSARHRLLHVLDEHRRGQFFDGCRLDAPSDVTKLVQAYPLRTIIKIINFFQHPQRPQVCERS
jgi:hypothetical protein